MPAGSTFRALFAPPAQAWLQAQLPLVHRAPWGLALGTPCRTEHSCGLGRVLGALPATEVRASDYMVQ